MKLIIIYGPPGVGKLTVAKELAKITRFKLLHNHLIADLVAAIFPFGSREYFPLAEHLRSELVRAAVKSKIRGLILTGVYAKGANVDLSSKFVKTVSKLVKMANGQLYLVQLICDRKELFRRLKHPSRKNFRKLKRVKILKDILKRYEILAPMDYGKSLIIDNTCLSPKKCALKIASHYKL
jgi:tRNA uridine 5-carbamoylmethylation protein Kti12